MTVLHCDECGKGLGEYLYGPGGIEERAMIVKTRGVGLPDIICNNCLGKRPTTTESRNL